jgi:hypothetical protein
MRGRQPARSWTDRGAANVPFKAGMTMVTRIGIAAAVAHKRKSGPDKESLHLVLQEKFEKEA